MVRYCTTHGIGYNPGLDPVCPQCSLARMPPAEALPVDEDPRSPDFGYPISDMSGRGDRNLPRVK